MQNLTVGLALEEPAPGERLPQDDGSGIDVRSSARPSPPFVQGAKYAIFPFTSLFGGRLLELPDRLRDPEIEHARNTVGSNQDVLGTDIPMNEVELLAGLTRGLVRGVKTVQARRPESAATTIGRNELLLAPRDAKELRERLPEHELHHEKELPLLRYDVERRDDVGVADPRRRAAPCRRTSRRRPDPSPDAGASA